MKHLLTHISANTSKSVAIFFAILCIFLLVLNALFPTQSDDLGAINGGLEAMKASYLNWNGRFFEMLRVGFIASIVPSAWFVVLNTLIALGLIYLLFILAFGRVAQSFSDVMILAILWLMIMHFGAFGSIFLWAAGSLNYLWAYFTIALVLVPYRLFWQNIALKVESKMPLLQTDCRFCNFIRALIFMCVCFVAGMSSEMVGVVVIICHVLAIIFAIYKRVKLPAWYVFGMLGFMAGWFALYFSPGHAKRIEVFWQLGGKSTFYTIRDILAMSFGEQLALISNRLIHFKTYANIIFVGTLLFVMFHHKFKAYKVALIVILVVLYFIFLNNTKHLVPFLKDYVGLMHFIALLLFFIAMARFYHKHHNANLTQLFIKLTIAFLLLSLLICTTIQVGIPDRARLCYVLIAALCIILLYQQVALNLSQIALKRLNITLLAITCAYGVFVLSAYVDTRLKWEAMANSINAQKAQGIEDVVVDKRTFQSFYHKLGDWGNPGKDADIWPNDVYAKYFGVRSFVVE